MGKRAKKEKVLVTGVGGASGLYTAKILKETGYYVLGVDANEYAAGKVLCDDFAVVPLAADRSAFIWAIRYLLGEYGIDIVLPNVDEELPIFAAKGLSSIISPPKTIECCLDKYKTYNAFLGKVPVPRTFIKLMGADNVVFPNVDEESPIFAAEGFGKIIVKPSRGRGSSGIHVFASFSDFLGCSPYLFRDGEFVVQDYIGGEEYTVDVLVGLNCKPYCIAPRKRLCTYGGVSQVGETVDSPRIVETVCNVCKVLKFYGPVNMQFIDTGETIYLIEINPRLSGGIGITYANGANFPDLAIRYHFCGLAAVPNLKYDVVYRYFVEGKL